MKRCYLELKRPVKDAITEQMNHCQENFIPYITILYHYLAQLHTEQPHSGLRLGTPGE